MSIELRVPSLGESITQATLGTWLKREGDAVTADEPVVEVESEKATVALPAPSAGVLRRILKPSGATVSVGELIGELEQADEPARTAQAAVPAAAAPAARPGPVDAARAPAPAASPASAPRAAPVEARPAVPAPSVAAGAPAAGAHPGPERVPPSLRRMLLEHGLTRADVVRALEARSAPAPLELPGAEGGRPPRPDERLVPMTPLRRTVARRLVEAQHQAAALTTFNEVDLSRVLALREEHGAAFQERHGVKLGFMGFFVKACVEALRQFPAVNAEVRGDGVLYKDHYDVGVAVGGGKGLVVPVVRNADALSFAEIEKAVAELAAKARENRITMDDLEGGTFTISNGGIYGSLLSTPILNPPQTGILGMHKIERRAVVGPDGQVRVRPMMYVALSYDHRIVDGREAVSFLVRVKECVESPERILLEA
jgi:2-oxoglutarate dehydrogenase E2 component (dihydrolipoamide succinyltransferase)